MSSRYGGVQLELLWAPTDQGHLLCSGPGKSFHEVEEPDLQAGFLVLWCTPSSQGLPALIRSPYGPEKAGLLCLSDLCPCQKGTDFAGESKAWIPGLNLGADGLGFIPARKQAVETIHAHQQNCFSGGYHWKTHVTWARLCFSARYFTDSWDLTQCLIYRKQLAVYWSSIGLNYTRNLFPLGYFTPKF